MNKHLTVLLHAFLVASMFAIALWTIHALPAGGQVAIHWGPDGRADAWVSERAGLLIIPLVACVAWFLVSMLPADARRTMSLSRALLILLAAQAVVAIHTLGSVADTSSHAWLAAWRAGR